MSLGHFSPRGQRMFFYMILLLVGVMFVGRDLWLGVGAAWLATVLLAFDAGRGVENDHLRRNSKWFAEPGGFEEDG